jgi:phage-related holin
MHIPLTKTLVIVMASAVLSPVMHILELYFFSDWEFLKFLCVLITGDTILGFVKHFKSGTIHSAGLGKIIYKLLAYMSVLIMTHVLTHYKVDGNPNTFLLWFDDLAYTALVVRESISILENIGAINDSLLPRWLLKKLKEFDHSGKFKTETDVRSTEENVS